jgi:hypothetical protein
MPPLVTRVWLAATILLVASNDRRSGQPAATPARFAGATKTLWPLARDERGRPVQRLAPIAYYLPKA